jgi:alpha-L-fucosidase
MGVFLLFVLCTTITMNAKAEDNKFEANYESLIKHDEAPQWLQDAKLGIYFHWGVYTVPAFETEHYIREMHKPDSKVGQHHLQTYGEPDKFPYHDFIPKFTAEKFDPQAWAQLVADAGAKFSGPVTEHHDGFAMWDSDITPWNAAKMGPKRDVLGEYSAAIKEHDLKLITTFHIGRHIAGHIPRIDGYPSNTDDPVLKQLYYSKMSDEEIMDVWMAKVDEVVKRYHPDILWFDSWLHTLPKDKKYEMIANYINASIARGQEPVISFKQEDLSKDIGIVDIEKGRMRDLQERPWLTDDTITWGWSYISRSRAKPFKLVLHSFVDTVSKNGILLLNISPRSDGTIPEDQVASLKRLGAWLDVYGDAIYATRPWNTYGSGPGDKELKSNVHGGVKGANYNWQDIRFTRKNNTVYVLQLGKAPQDSKHVISAFLDEPSKVISVKSLVNKEDLLWEITEQGLEITVPTIQPDDLVNVYEVTLANTASK